MDQENEMGNNQDKKHRGGKRKERVSVGGTETEEEELGNKGTMDRPTPYGSISK